MDAAAGSGINAKLPSQLERYNQYRSDILNAKEGSGVEAQGDTFVVTKDLQVYGPSNAPLKTTTPNGFEEQTGLPPLANTGAFAGAEYRTFIAPGTVIHQQPQAGDKVLVQHDDVKHIDDPKNPAVPFFHGEYVAGESFEQKTEHHFFAGDRTVLEQKSLDVRPGQTLGTAEVGDKHSFDLSTNQLTKPDPYGATDYYARELGNEQGIIAH